MTDDGLDGGGIRDTRRLAAAFAVSVAGVVLVAAMLLTFCCAGGA